MRTIDLIKQWLAKPAFCTQSAPGDYGAGGPAPLGRSTRTEAPDPRHSRIQLSSRRQGDQVNASDQVVSTRSARSHPFSNNKATCSHDPAITAIYEAITRVLHPVDWASLQTLSRYIGTSYESITHHLRELEEQGKVGMGKRLVPPDMRTIAWLTDSGRSDLCCRACDSSRHANAQQQDVARDVKGRR